MRVLSTGLSVTLLLTVAIATMIVRHLYVAHAASVPVTNSSLQSQINSQSQEISILNQKIAEYEAEIQQAGANKETLQNAINALNLQRNKVEVQVSAMQHQINLTQLQIQQLGDSISTTKLTIEADQAALGEEMRSLQKIDAQPFIVQVFSSGSLGQVWSNVDNTLQIQSAIQNEVGKLKIQEGYLSNSQTASIQKQNTLSSQRQSLASQQQALSSTEKSKRQLLFETGAKESNYKKLLAAAKAQLVSFSTFAENAGGSGLLANQTTCDAWGCYYNQRDVAWGNDPLNGTQYPMKSDGCLVTAMAMVMTHYGYRNVTPVTINANPNNFAAYYPAYLLFTINVDGVSATRKAAAINATLATGNPVIVGLYAYGGTHYVVLTSGHNGNYLMRDPYIPNGNNISFSAHYSLNSIFGISKVEISG